MQNRSIGLTRFLGAILVAWLGGCAHLPNTATPESAASISATRITEATPLATLIKERGIASLDPGSTAPLLEQAMVELGKSDKAARYRGVTYDLTYGNKLGRDWLIQTPDIWDRSGSAVPELPVDCTNCDADFRLPLCRKNSDCPVAGARCGTLQSFAARRDLAGRKMCLGQSDPVIDRWYALILRANETVDINLFQPAPDTRFLAALRGAITMLARSRRPVVVRVLVGQYPPDDVDASALIEQLVRDARSVRFSRLTVYVAAMRTCSGTLTCHSFSWNHSKAVAIDGKRALVGGHNLRSADYLGSDPIHDLSMELEGPAAADIDRFADSLWGFVCANAGSDPVVTSLVYRAGMPDIGKACLPKIAPSHPATGHSPDPIPVLAVGRLATGITTDFANQSELARDLLFGAARRTLRISQQDIAYNLVGIPVIGYPTGVTYPDSTLERVADFLLSGGDAYIVVSNEGAAGASTKLMYSNGVSLADVARKIREVTQGRNRSGADLTALLCQHLHLAPFRFGPDPAWPDGLAIGNHAKFWMVDDRIFYIGSDNIYPADLQEFGFIVDDREASATLRRDYWDPLWRWSSRAAISGSEAPTCVFRDQAPS